MTLRLLCSNRFNACCRWQPRYDSGLRWLHDRFCACVVHSSALLCDPGFCVESIANTQSLSSSWSLAASVQLYSVAQVRLILPSAEIEHVDRPTQLFSTWQNRISRNFQLFCVTETSLNERFPYASHDCNSECAQAFWVIGSNNSTGG